MGCFFVVCGGLWAACRPSTADGIDFINFTINSINHPCSFSFNCPGEGKATQLLSFFFQQENQSFSLLGCWPPAHNQQSRIPFKKRWLNGWRERAGARRQPREKGNKQNEALARALALLWEKIEMEKKINLLIFFGMEEWNWLIAACFLAAGGGYGR